MFLTQAEAAARMVAAGQSLFARGLAHGASGNISVRLSDGFLLTPTGVGLGELQPQALSVLNLAGEHVAGPPPTKECRLHLAMYDKRPGMGAVVHLHASHSAAVSCIADIDPDDVLPALTAYYVMRIGRLPLVEFYAPGAPELAAAVAAKAMSAHALLLANHGPIVGGRTLEDAIANIEELEATAKLHLLLHGRNVRVLRAEQIARLEAIFGKAGGQL